MDLRSFLPRLITTVLFIVSLRHRYDSQCNILSNFNFNFKSHDNFSALPSLLQQKEYILGRKKKK